MNHHPDYDNIMRPLLDGNKAAVQSVFDQSFPAMLTYVQRGGGNRQDAEDVFMNSLEVLFLLARRPGFQLTSALSTLLYGIGRLQWLKLADKKKRLIQGTNEPEVRSIETADDVAEAMQQAERYVLYREKFAQLGSDCQKMLLLSFQNLSNTAIASAMGFSNEAYFRKRKHLCKNLLIRLIREDRRYQELRHDP